MTPFPQPFTARAAPLMADNVDTDIIIPSREIKTTGRTGLAQGLFAPWRYANILTRAEDPTFVLNQPDYRSAQILAVGDNFGCGSSREHAAWAMTEFGIVAIIAVSFASIFRGNCVRNGVLPITLERPVVEALGGAQVTIDLAAQTVTVDGTVHHFAIDIEAKEMLAHGLDAIDLSLTQADAIDAWTAADKQARPWVYLERK